MRGRDGRTRSIRVSLFEFPLHLSKVFLEVYASAHVFVHDRLVSTVGDDFMTHSPGLLPGVRVGDSG